MNFLPRRPFPESRFRQKWLFVTIWLFVIVKSTICQGVFGRKSLDFRRAAVSLAHRAAKEKDALRGCE